MTARAGLEVLQAGPGITLQDPGREGYLAQGLSRGGAMDPLALIEGAVLLGQPPDAAHALEMAGFGGKFRAVGGPLTIALTGAPMRAVLDGRAVPWPCRLRIPEGEVLSIGAAGSGVCGYLTVAGGFDCPLRLGACSAHLAAGLGAAIGAGEVLWCAAPQPEANALTLDPVPRFDGGEIRILPSFQTGQFDEPALRQFEATEFRKDLRGSRMGVRLVHDGPAFEAKGHLDILSEVIVPGDIQIVGDGTPFVLLPECQTTGGYPRIATVISADLVRVAQATPGASLKFRFVTLHEALAERARTARYARDVAQTVRPLVRDPADMADLLSYQWISGVTSGQDDDQTLNEDG